MYGQAIGYFTNCDDALCLDCFKEVYVVDHHDALIGADHGTWPGFEEWESPLAIFEEEAIDSPTHCTECRRLIECDLTEEGLRYVAESIGECFVEGRQNPVVKQWIDCYGELLDDVTLPQADGVNIQDAIGLFFLLPKDMVWAERDDLRKHAVNAGWVE